MPSSRRYSVNKAISHVLGDNKQLILLIIFIIASVSWIGDLLLNLMDSYLSQHLKKRVDVDLSLLLLSIISLVLLVNSTGLIKYSNRYKAFNIDPERHNRKKLIITLSGFASRKEGNKLKSDQALQAMMSILETELTPGTHISELTGGDFDSNWIPALKAIQHYQALDEVIVLTTSIGASSFHQYDDFKLFVQHYFKNTDRNFSINSQATSIYIEDKDLKEKVEEGIPSNDPFLFAKTVLDILDSIEDENKYDRSYIQNKVVIDVTSGKASMSAALGAISGSQGIFLHYMDTESKDSHELDISAS